MMKHFSTIVLILAAVAITSCSPWKRINYIQDINDKDVIAVATDYQIKFKPLDRITVVVSSKDPELAAPFNATSSFNSLSNNPLGTSSYNGTSSLQVLTLDHEGMLDMPIIGKINCLGKTREEVSATIEKMIIDGHYISDPMVNIQFADMKIFVLGEVTKPGQFDITRDRVSILDALAMAGDLTIYGDRTNIFVVRHNEAGKEVVHKMNILDSGIFSSPAYFLQQGDVVYVRPNKYKSATAEINQNRSFWISIVSTLISVATLVVTIVKK